MPALSTLLPTYRGSSVTSVTTASNVVIDSGPQQGSVCDSVTSALASTGASGPLASPFAWDVDGAHTHALVSPVHLAATKKKGGLLSNLKKIFNHQKADGRAATGEGRRETTEHRQDIDVSVGSSDGTGFLEAPSKIERSVKPLGIKVQVSSSRDLTLAALLTSPVRVPAPPGSPGILNSPMPSMRFENAGSSNLNSDCDAVPSGPPPPEHQRLFPVFTRTTSSRPLGQATSHAPPMPSLSAHLPAAQKSQHAGTMQKSATSNLLPSAGGGVSYSSGAGSVATAVQGTSPFTTQVLTRGESEELMSSLRGSNNGRVALPYLNSGRNLEPTVSSSGRAPVVPVPRAIPELTGEEEDEEEGAEEGVEEGAEEDEPPVRRLLGMNPAVPAAMRRRRWALEDYNILKRMYKGQTSAVYRATCTKSGITVALKVYFLHKVPVNVVHMIEREINLHMPLVHRNIVMLYGAFKDDKHIVLVEEYAARGDLFGIHRGMNCRLTETQTSELILVPFLDALSYLHARGIMHRDIKPENILFTQDWALKIADFGVSINVQEERAVTRTGTADYMAPEVERCPLKHAPEDNKGNPQLAYTTAIDIWSVGVLAYEMLVGFPPFVSSTAAEDGWGSRAGVAAFMAEQATRKTLRFPASVSAAAKDFIMATLNENPGDRPTAQQLLKHPWLFKAARRTSITASRFSNSSMTALGPH